MAHAADGLIEGRACPKWPFPMFRLGPPVLANTEISPICREEKKNIEGLWPGGQQRKERLINLIAFALGQSHFCRPWPNSEHLTK